MAIVATENKPTKKDRKFMAKKTAPAAGALSTEVEPSKPSGPSAAMLALFAKPPEGHGAKLVRRNMPMLVKPDSVPVGGAVTGEIIQVCKSPVSTVKGFLLWLKHDSGQEFTFPCTGVIRNALAPGVTGDKELLAELEKEVGKKFVAVRQENKPNAKYKKEMFMFDVFTTAK